MVNLKLNGRFINSAEDFTILQICEIYNIVIPRFCYHEFLTIAGNCRMCLVEVKKSLKPVAACAMPVSKDMVIFTESSLVRKAREGVLEFLLYNHPLDCPICDQGGECDLQDQSIVFGNDRGRFFDYKRSLQNKYFGSFIKTEMTRCIHCTRCVRFAQEVGNFGELGITGRGGALEIGTYIESIFESELSSNISDLCPVGALTIKPSAFKSRRWELSNIECLDIFDTFGSNVMISVRGLDIVRISPGSGLKNNWDWITDKVRFCYDGLKQQRSSYPRVKFDFLYITTWDDVLKHLIFILNLHKDIKGILGSFVNLEVIVLFKEFLNLYNGFILFQNEIENFSDHRSFYLFYFSIYNIDFYSFCLNFQVDLKYELPLLHSRFFYNANLGLLDYFNFGGSGFYLKSIKKFGVSFEDALKILEGKSKISVRLIQTSADRLLFFIGNYFLVFFNSLLLIYLFNFFITKFKILPQIVRTESSLINALELGLLPSFWNKAYSSMLFNLCGNFSYLFNVENLNFKNKKDYYVFQGFQLNDFIFKNVNIILPGVAFTEIGGIFINIFGKKQFSNFVNKGPGDSLSDDVIFLSLFSYISELFKFLKTNFLSSMLFLFNKGFIEYLWFNKLYSFFLINQNGFVKVETILIAGLRGLYALNFGQKSFYRGNFLIFFIKRFYNPFCMFTPNKVLYNFIWNYFLTSNITELSVLCSSVVWVPRIFKN